MAKKAPKGLSTNVLTLFTILLVLVAIFTVVSMKNDEASEVLMMEEEAL